VGATAPPDLLWYTSGGALSPWISGGGGMPPSAHPLAGKAVFDPATNTYEVSAVYTGMPANNNAFGLKQVYAQIVDAGQVVGEGQQFIEVFYDRYGRPANTTVPWNNPGTGAMAGPNWFYYWKEGGVVRGPSPESAQVPTSAAGFTPDWVFDPNMPTGTIGYYMPGDQFVNVGDVAHAYYGYPFAMMAPETLPPTNSPKYGILAPITVTGTGIGPFFCAEVVSHEWMHLWYDWVIGAQISAAELDGDNNGDNYDDPDDDGIPNIHETTGYCNVWSDVNDPDTYDMDYLVAGYYSYGDQEVRCRMRSLINHGGMIIDFANDWAYPGLNSVPIFPIP